MSLEMPKQRVALFHSQMRKDFKSSSSDLSPQYKYSEKKRSDKGR